ncbi:MAG TPA: hypothetical protein VFJ85_00845 [Acidimicrobiales bacterium]|nr:hypothetical protein [Acidimicrobiales bacterium]
MQPPSLAPMLAGASGAPRDVRDYLVEPKWDGVRAILTVHDGRLRIASRTGRDVTSHYPELAPLAAALGGRQAVLDAEIVTFDERGAPSFQRLQSRMHVAAPGPELQAEVPVVAMPFDLLWLDGELLTALPQRERRQRLEGLDLDGPSWHLTPLIAPASADELLAACGQVGLEGCMLKRAEAPYLPGRRSSSWVKLKCVRRQELVVGGWIPGEGSRTGSIGSLAVGIYGLDRATGGSDGRLRFVAAVGSGLSEDWIRQLKVVAERLATDRNPFADRVSGVHFLEPRLVAEVGYSHVNDGGILRHPTLKGFRTDVDPDDIVADDDLQAAIDGRPAGFRIRC